MTQQSELDNLKQTVRIVDFLYTEGHKPAYFSGLECVYHSPLRKEGNPSFHVNTKLNSFKDFGEADHRGDIIGLVRRMKSLSFPQAVQYLKSWDGQTLPDSLSLSGHIMTDTDPEESKIIVQDIRSLSHPALITYLESRCISPVIGCKYLHEVRYTNKRKYRFGLGFKNDKGGFSIRTKYFKDATKPAHFTTITKPGSTSVNLFEGFFDFLSALEYYQLREPSRTTIVLNSVSMLARSLETLRQFDKVYCYLDKDAPGQKALARLANEGIPVIDQSNLYQNHNDFNEFYINHCKSVS